MNPLVSVCMPLFNTEKFVAEAVEGVLAQTWKDLELIICDNGSTDRSLEIVENLAKRDPRIRLFRNKRNLGYAGNLHKVLSLAQGKFMMVHCADDLSDPAGIERMVALATAPGVDQDRVMVLTDCYITDGAGKPSSIMTQDPEGFGLRGCFLD